MSEDSAAPASGKFGDLRTRLISAFTIGVVALVCIWLGGWWIAALATLAMVAMIRELWTMVMQGDGPTPGAKRVLTMGILYILMAGLAFVWLRAQEPYGFLSILWAAFVVTAADVGGYFAGRIIGGPKLWPAISPKKTWAGMGGGVALAFVVGGLFSWATTGTYFIQVCVVSMIAAVVSQGGDLAEAALKRHFAVKDASSLIPGHGGVLDRLDGHMAAVLVAAAFTAWRDQAVFIW